MAEVAGALEKWARVGASSMLSAGASVASLISPEVGITAAIAAPVLDQLASDWLNRTLSRKERDRVGELFFLVSEQVTERIKAGAKLRTDLFPEGQAHEAAAEEVIEGALRKAQAAYENRKLWHISCLTTDVLLDPSLGVSDAKHLLELAESLTYRQFLVLGCIGSNLGEGLMGLSDQPVGLLLNGAAYVDLIYEIFDLRQRALVRRRDENEDINVQALGGWTDIEAPGTIVPNKLVPWGLGQILIERLRLQDADPADLREISRLLRDSEDPTPRSQ